MTELITYTNALGDKVVLDDLPRTFIGELYGRRGFEAPSLKKEEAEYGSGATEIVSLQLEPREITLFFWAPAGTRDLNSRLDLIKSRLVQIGRRSGSWGTLRVAKPDGSYCDIDCVYTGGLEDTIRDSWNYVKFGLTFQAEDPLFYDLSTTELILQTFSEGDRLVFKSSTHFGADTHFRSPDADHSETVDLDCFRVYPDIEITGPANNIRLINVSTGKTIRFEPTFELLAGEKLEIHTKPNDRSCWWVKTNNTRVRALRYLAADTTLDWDMIAGKNVLRYRNSYLSPLSHCKLSFRRGYLSA